jgi:uncharacterized protein YjbJ (UPF0337 family)
MQGDLVTNDGKQDQATGKLKKTAGDLTGDDEMRSEGKTQEKKGGAKEKLEDAKESVQGAMKGAGGKDDGDRT